MTTNERCAELREALTEVALGVADGTTRGVVMAHLATCDRCREELSSLAAAADELLLLVPEREPSAGFEGRVLAQLASEKGPRSQAEPDHAIEPDRTVSEPEHPAGPERTSKPDRPTTVRRHRVRRTVLATAVGVGLIAVGGTSVWLATAPDRDLAASYRTTLDTADGRYLAAADLVTDAGIPDTGPGSPTGYSARSVGTVFLYEGDPSWAYVVVRDAGAAASYDVVVTVDGTVDGTREVALGSCFVADGTCTAGGVLDVAVHDVVSVRLTDPGGATWATATPRATWP